MFARYHLYNTGCHPLKLLKSVTASQSAQCKELEETLCVKEEEIAHISQERARLVKDLEMVNAKNLEMDHEISLYHILLEEGEAMARCV